MADSPRLVALRRRVQSDPASTAFAQLADECCRLGRFEEAAACCRSGLTRHPSYLSAHVILARALTALGKFDEAAAEFELVLSTAADNLSAKRGLAELEERRAKKAGEVPPKLANDFAPGETDATTAADAASAADAGGAVEPSVAPESACAPDALVSPEGPVVLAAPASVRAESLGSFGETSPAAPTALVASAPAREEPLASFGEPSPAVFAAPAESGSARVESLGSFGEASAASAVGLAEDPLALLEIELRDFEESRRAVPSDPAAEALAELEAWLVALRTPRTTRGRASRG